MNLKLNDITSNSWHHQVKEAKIDSVSLCQQLNITAKDIIETPAFPVFAPKHYLALINPADTNDPLLLQIIASKQELIPDLHSSLDPLQEKNFEVAPGLLHKYSNRVLWLTTQACPINCRYCFRRNHQVAPALSSNLQQNLAWIKANPQIDEVILSGGDPLMLSNRKLERILQGLAMLDQIKVIRFHSRFPIVIPDRIDNGFLTLCKNSNKQLIMVLHTNHPNELSPDVATALQDLSASNVKLYSQSVLLKNINDNSTVLAQLCRKLYSFGVQPYYLHYFDRVTGASHFAVEMQQAQTIYDALLAQVSGYMAPKFVVELPNKASKSAIGSVFD